MDVGIPPQDALSVLRVDKLAEDGERLLGCSLVRPWRAMPLVRGEIEVEGQLRTTTPVTRIELLQDGRTLHEFPLVERSERGRADVCVVGFESNPRVPDPGRATTLALRATLAAGPPIEFARIALGRPEYSLDQAGRLAPDFLIVGAMKAGTTSLYDLLTQHPRVLRREPKEIHFFNRNFDKGIEYYRSFFADKLDDPPNARRLAGDATPAYMSPFHPEVAARVRAAFPQVRIIVSLRDPAERAISHYHHNRNFSHSESLPLEEVFSAAALAARPGPSDDYLLYGCYLECLEPWLAAFPRDSLLIVDFHDLARRPQDLLPRLFRHIGLEPAVRLEPRKSLANEYPTPPAAVVQRLRDYYRPHNERLAQRLGREFDFNRPGAA